MAFSWLSGEYDVQRQELEMVTPLPDAEVMAALTHLDGWRVDGGRLVREVRRGTEEVDDLVARVAVAADALDHHPVVDVIADGARFTVWTHSVDALTSRDLTLAAAIDHVVRDSVGA